MTTQSTRPDWLTVGAKAALINGAGYTTAWICTVERFTATQVIVRVPGLSVDKKFRLNGLHEIGVDPVHAGMLVAADDPRVLKIQNRSETRRVAHDVAKLAETMRKAQTDEAAREAARNAIATLNAYLEA